MKKDKPVIKLTAKDLIAKKMELLKGKFKTIYIPSIDGDLEFEKPDKETALMMLDAGLVHSADANALYEASRRAIYECCPTLRCKELHAEYDVTDPYDIVDKFMDVNEICVIGGELVDFYGTLNAVDKAIKNS